MEKNLKNESWDACLGGIWWFPQIRGTFLGVPIIRTIIFWGLYWGPPILGNYHRTYIRIPREGGMDKKLDATLVQGFRVMSGSEGMNNKMKATKLLGFVSDRV